MRFSALFMGHRPRGIRPTWLHGGMVQWSAWMVLLLPAFMFGPFSAWADRVPGLEIEVFYVGEIVRNAGGGLRTGDEALGSTDLGIHLDTAEAGWWAGGYVYAEILTNHGADPSASLIGDIQTASNIADRNRMRLQQLWYEQRFDGGLSLLFGWHDMNSEFYVSEQASLFMNSSFGIGPEISVNVPASLWPEAGAGLRLAYAADGLLWMAAVYDGDPTTRGIHPSREGLMLITELDCLHDGAVYKLGAWRHSGDRTGPDGRQFGSDAGVYVLADQPLFGWEDGKAAMFMQLGLAQADRNEIDRYVGLGLHVHGPLPGRSDDSLGLAVARAHFSDAARRALGRLDAETVIELDYDAVITAWLHVHPALQWILHPGGDPLLSTARVGMLRVELALP